MTVAIRVERALPDQIEVRARLVDETLTPLDGGTLHAAACARVGFAGKAEQCAVLPGADGALEVLVGVGAGEPGAETLRRAGAAICSAVPGAAEVGCVLPPSADASAARALVEGVLLAGYRYTRYHTPEVVPALSSLVLAATDPDAARAGAAAGEAVAAGVVLARDLVNTPAADCTPSDVAARARALAEAEGLEFSVYDADAARREGLGGLLGVAAGSAQPPLLVRLAYRPEGASCRVALVGKGITFDSGGLSLKTAPSMETMKTDLGGAAAVLGALSACRRLDIAVEVVGFLPLTENMPGGRALKPGDVLRARNGKTIEVLNTDAEGRLVLADALSLAAEERPDAIVDLATLTGSCVVALGREIAGLFANDARLAAQVRAAGERAGEPNWPLPLPARYRRLLDSEIADMRNVGTRDGGALLAGLVLQEFVGEVPWAHLDIAGPARAEHSAGYLREGATGFGVRTLLELLAGYRPVGGVAERDPLVRVELP